VAIACGLSLAACGANDDFGNEDVELRAQIASMEHFELAQDGSRASRATASIWIDMRDGDGHPVIHDPDGDGDGYSIRGSCGATFISPRYAVTAAHCLQKDLLPDPYTQGVLLQTYDITEADEHELLEHGRVEGNYPDYYPGNSVDHIDGYVREDYECWIAAACSSTWTDVINCEDSADIALLYCPDRPDDAAWLAVAEGDSGTGDVEMYWFHELLEMPVRHPGAGASDEELDRFEHYTKHPGPNLADAGNNVHYLAAKVNDLMPLRSLPWPNGGPNRRRTGVGTTDLYGCHGTSGSGVLAFGDEDELELLGPATTPLGPSWGDNLCMNPDFGEVGMSSIGYASNAALRELEIAFGMELYLDRGIELEP
jgi:hypothetical protein